MSNRMESLFHSRNFKASGWYLADRGPTKAVHHHAIHRHLVLKVAYNGMEEDLECEYRELERLRNMSVRPERLPWTGAPFQLRFRNGPSLGLAMLQARLNGDVVKLNKLATGYSSLGNGSSLAAQRTMGDAMSWESALRRARLGVANMHFVRKQSGDLWLIDPVCSARQRYERRQSWMLASLAMGAALTAHTPRALRNEALCYAASCDVGCAFVFMPPSVRATLLRSGNDRVAELLVRLRRLMPAPHLYSRALRCSGCLKAC